MPELAWEREVEGRNVQAVRISGDRIALGYLDDQGQSGSPGPLVLEGYDLEGHRLWRLPELRAQCSTREGFVVLTEATGEPSLLDHDGRPVRGVRDGDRPVECRGVRSVEKHGRCLELRTETELLVVDEELRLLDRVPLPAGEKAAWAPFLGDGFVWVEGREIVRSDRIGGKRPLGTVPGDLAEEVLQRFEQETGQPALGNMLTFEPVALDDWSKVVDAIRSGTGRPARVGERFGYPLWRPGVDREAGVLFLANLMPPHVVLCMDLDGRPRWAAYLSGSCCGGTPEPLPSGLYVASSGCGGILSWLSPDGSVVFRSEPHEGVGLATAYDNRVRVLDDSTCLVVGGPGLVAYSAHGERLWVLTDGCSTFDCDEERQLLVVASWRAEPAPMRVWLRCLRGLDE